MKKLLQDQEGSSLNTHVCLELRHFGGATRVGKVPCSNVPDSSSIHYPKVDTDPFRMRRVCAACWLNVAVNSFARSV